MSGDISLSQALGGLRIANLSNDSLPEPNTPQEDKSSASAADDHQNGQPGPQPLDGAAGPSSTSSYLGRTPLDPPAEPNVARPLHTTNNHPTTEAPALVRSAAGFQDPLGEHRLQRQHTAPLHPASHDSERAQHTSTRPVSAAFAGSMSVSQDSDASSSYYQPMLRPETSQSSMFDAISRSNSRSVRTPYAGPIPQRVPSRRVYNPDAMRDLPPGVAPPRKSSRNQGGGYSDQPPGAMVPPQSGNNFGAQLPAPGNREEWQERGAAVGVRREVDSEGRAVLRSVKKGVKDFKFDRILGEGSYSTVYLATDRGNNKEYAVKVLEKKHIIKEKKIKYVNIEKNTLNRLTDHPGIVRLFYTFQDETSLYYVLDLCGGGELLGVLKRTGTFDVDCTRFYGAEILDAIDYMHSRGVIHRDLKPENVLLDSGMHVKITDFGTAKLLPDPRDPKPPADEASEDGRAASFVGTAEYVSPELLTDKTAGKASDIWAFGCIIYQLLAGRPPFKAGTEYLTFQKIVGLEYEFPPGFPPAARDLVERCLVLDPAMRLTVEHIKNHEFFDGIRVSRLLWKQKAPRLRPYMPPAQEPHIIQLNGASSSSLPQSRQLPSSNNGATRPSRIITELPPPTQLDIEWSPVLTKSNERILKLGDLIVTSSPVPNSPHGKQDHETHRKISKFFTGSTLKKKQRLVMVTSSGRIVLAPAGGGEKKAKLEISLLNPDCVWRTQLDTKGQMNWSVDSNGTHYLFEQPKSSSSLSVDAGTAHDWVEALEKAKDLAISQDLMGSDNGFGDMPSSLSSSPSNTISRSMQFSEGGFGVADRAGRHHLSKSQASLDDPQQTKKTHRFSKRQSKNGLGTAAF